MARRRQCIAHCAARSVYRDRCSSYRGVCSAEPHHDASHPRLYAACARLYPPGRVVSSRRRRLVCRDVRLCISRPQLCTTGHGVSSERRGLLTEWFALSRERRGLSLVVPRQRVWRRALHSPWRGLDMKARSLGAHPRPESAGPSRFCVARPFVRSQARGRLSLPPRTSRLTSASSNHPPPTSLARQALRNTCPALSRRARRRPRCANRRPRSVMHDARRARQLPTKSQHPPTRTSRLATRCDPARIRCAAVTTRAMGRATGPLAQRTWPPPNLTRRRPRHTTRSCRRTCSRWRGTTRSACGTITRFTRTPQGESPTR